MVSVRKLFSDPMKAAVRLYVITFLGPRPTSIKIGYTKYTIDQHIPNPMRCGNCCRWGTLQQNAVVLSLVDAALVKDTNTRNALRPQSAAQTAKEIMR